MASTTEDVRWHGVTIQNSSSDDAALAQTLLSFHNAVYLIWRVGPPIALLLGVFGNLMIILIMRRFSDSSLTIFFQVMAWSDLLLLTVGLLPIWLREVFGTMLIEELGSVPCQLCKVVKYTAGVVSPWMLVALTLQRAASVLWPHRLGAVWTRGKSRAVAAVVVVVFFLMHCHFFYGWALDKERCKSYLFDCCSIAVSQSYGWFFLVVWPWIDLFEFCLLPFLLLVISNCVLLWTLVGSVRTGKHLPVQQAAQDSRQKKISSLTVTLLSASVSFLLMTTPITVYFLVEAFVGAAVMNKEPIVQARFMVFWAASNVLWYSSSSINFYLYCLTGTRFRAEFQHLMSRVFHPLSETQEVKSEHTSTRPSAMTSSLSDAGAAGDDRKREVSDSDF
ncbi:sex peptide receptor-related protein 2-like [Babylonia areolata]|uniref:sex peptide receptor-related protein 2-like n=1 Tax=Babylonia areolata TaxID=304850 RepID=UPI003FD6A9C6